MSVDCVSLQEFQQKLLKTAGILSYDETETLYDIAKRCSRLGVAMGAGVGYASAGAGAVVVPGVGAVPGYLVGFLAGMATGTAACVAVNLKFRDELKGLVVQCKQ